MVEMRKYIIVIILIVCGLIGLVKPSQANDTEQTQGSHPLIVEVILERMYLDGEFSQEVVKETIWSMEDFWAKYEEWQLIEMDDKRVVFRENIDDISPLLKTNGYFGITNDGILTIYNGDPNRSEIIHTFFQLDIGKLESHKHEELKKGIPIKTKDRYVEVLETFKSYSLETKQAN